MAVGSYGTCLRCRAPLAATDEVCGTCGAVVESKRAGGSTAASATSGPVPSEAPAPPPPAPAPVAAAPIPPTQPSVVVTTPATGSTKRGVPAWAYAVGGAAAALALTFGVLALTGGGDDDPAVAADPTPTVAATSDPAPSPEQTEDAEPVAEETSAAPTEEAEPEPPPVRCWDGSRAERINDCSPPSGKKGFRWVFPDLVNTTCAGSTHTGSRPQILACSGYLDDGTLVDVNYSQWYRVAPGVRHYDENAYDKEMLDNGLVRWSIISYDDEYKAALMYADAPWSVTIYAPSESARDRGVRAFASMRPRAQLLGTE